jgi:hypothetical protein
MPILSTHFQNKDNMKKVLFSLSLLLCSAYIYANPVVHIEITADTTDYSIYEGVYKLDENGVLDTYTVTSEGGKIFGQANGYDKTELTKQSADHSFKSGYGSDVIFVSEAADKPITKVKLVIQGNTVFGTKQ